jgi:transposase InsO family protein
VDSVTQFQLVATCEKISEASLLPVIRQLLEEFPCVILGFHADNGSEYINDTVALLLEKWRIEVTKSRRRHSNDNALAEPKNGAVVRKHLGYAHIPQPFASQGNAFCRHHLNPYVNVHRPCFFPETITDAKGTARKRYHYRDMKTPYGKLKSLPDVRQYLNPDMTVAQLDGIASMISDTEAALALNQARRHLFQAIEAASRKQA